MEKLVGQLPTFFLWSNPWAWLSLCFMASWQMIALMVYHLSRSKGFQTHLCDLSEFKRPTIHRAYLIHENSCSTWKDLSLIKLSIIRLLYTVKKENKKHTYSKFRIEQYQMIFWLLLSLILANAFTHVGNNISTLSFGSEILPQRNSCRTCCWDPERTPPSEIAGTWT